MAAIATIFCDIGGVILSNGWGRDSRRAAADAFHLDFEEFEERHDLIFPAYDSGHATLNEYLDRTIFYKLRPFSREEFTAFMLAQSTEYPETRAILDAITASRRYFIAALNNEPLELNQYRIEAFSLRRNFAIFFSSCFVGTRKPDPAIFRLALQVTQRSPEECLFIDDRPLNLESPRRLGLNVVHYQNPEQLRNELSGLGIEFSRP